MVPVADQASRPWQEALTCFGHCLLTSGTVEAARWTAADSHLGAVQRNFPYKQKARTRKSAAPGLGRVPREVCGGTAGPGFFVELIRQIHAWRDVQRDGVNPGRSPSPTAIPAWPASAQVGSFLAAEKPPPPYLLGCARASRVRAREGRRCRHGSSPPAAGMAWGVLPPAPLVRRPLMGTCGLIADS